MPQKTVEKIYKRYKKHVRKLSLAYAHRLHRWEHRKEYAVIDRYLRKFKSTGGLKNFYGGYKLWNLNQLLLRFNPKRILEFGSGSSTMVFCDFLRSNEGSLLSIDEEEKWAANTRRLVHIETTEGIEIINSKKVCLSDSVPREIKYDLQLTDKYDFVFIDGPSLSVNGVKWKDAVNSNIFELNHNPSVIVVDGRRATARYIAQKYSDIYHASLSDLFSDRPVQCNYNFFSFFIKKKNS